MENVEPRHVCSNVNDNAQKNVWKFVIQEHISKIESSLPIFQHRFWITNLGSIFSHVKILVLKQFNNELLTTNSNKEIHKQLK